MRLHRKGVMVGVCAALAAGVVMAVAGVGASATTTTRQATGGTLNAGVLHAFTGQNAFFGSNAQVACEAAASKINAAGGIMGNTLKCPTFDTKGDPADAVPVTAKMLASTSSLVMVVGPDGNDIPAVLPLLAQSKTPEMNTVGDPRYDRQTSPYFWRLTPSDSTQGPALAWYAAVRKHWKRAAAVFTSDLSATSDIDPFLNKYKKLGGTVAVKLSLQPGQASYQTEVARVIAAKPQVLIGDLDARTAATFLTQLQQQNGTLIPFVAAQRALQGDWANAVVPAVGGDSVQKYVTVVSPNLSLSGIAFNQFKAAVKKAGGNDFQTSNPFVAATYDGVTVFALAMEMAKSTSPGDYVNRIAGVTSLKPGAVIVRTYKQGVAALNRGQKIQYLGASGSLVFDKWHTANRTYTASVWNAASKTWKVVGLVPKAATQP
jgi:branched-chain amino acid transport system substrate-binding protein